MNGPTRDLQKNRELWVGPIGVRGARSAVRCAWRVRGVRLKEERRVFGVPQPTFEKFVNIYWGARRLSGLRLSVEILLWDVTYQWLFRIRTRTCENFQVFSAVVRMELWDLKTLGHDCICLSQQFQILLMWSCSIGLIIEVQDIRDVNIKTNPPNECRDPMGS